VQRAEAYRFVEAFYEKGCVDIAKVGCFLYANPETIVSFESFWTVDDLHAVWPAMEASRTLDEDGIVKSRTSWVKELKGWVENREHDAVAGSIDYEFSRHADD
jgi:hypothetical protein